VRREPVDHIVKTLLDAEIPVAPVKTIPQVAVDPHLWEREMLVRWKDPVAGEMYLPGATIKMSKTPGRVGPVPTPGHTPTSSYPGFGLRRRDPGGIAAREGDRLSSRMAAVGAPRPNL